MVNKYFLTILFFGIYLSQGWCQSSVDKIFSQFAKEQGIYNGEKFKTPFDEGVYHFRQRKYQQAAQAFGKASLASPLHPTSNFYLCCSLFALKQYHLAGVVLRRTVHLYPHWDTLSLNIRTTFPEFLSLYATFKRWRYSGSHSTDSYFLYAFISHYARFPREAESSYLLIMQQDASYLEASKFLGILKGQQIDVLFPTWEKFTKRAQIAFNKREFEKAISSWGDAFAYYPEKAQVLYNLCNCFCAKQDFSHAESVLHLATQLAPQEFSKQFNIEQHFGSQDNLDNIMQILQSALQQDPENRKVLLLLSYFYVISNDKQKANLALQHLKQVTPQSYPVDFLLFQLNQKRPQIPFNKKQNDRPFIPKNQTADKKVEKKRDTAEVVAGKRAFKNEQYRKAGDFFAKAIVKKPDNIEAQWLLGMATFANAQYSLTYKIIRKLFTKRARKLDWNQYYNSTTLFNKHLKQLTKWVSDHPDDNEALFVLGYLFATGQRKSQARAIFRRLSQRMPDDKIVQYFARKLK